MRFNNRNNDGSKIKTVVLIVFVLIIIMGLLTSCAKPEEPAAPKGPTQEELLAEIRDLLKKK